MFEKVTVFLAFFELGLPWSCDVEEERGSTGIVASSLGGMEILILLRLNNVFCTVVFFLLTSRSNWGILTTEFLTGVFGAAADSVGVFQILYMLSLIHI